ncbi:TetR/AcrR family transcriptional regulator [Sneathiella limimaris]|uniref:TetR/AcrR family transcriptional regulator n=1 Tax=Sneathiella limimaris TaxID=1964213 RepID=UPI00146BD057|nr:TetR/AcrR family transcriptional regulator [Sneathiella limimaris]
MKETRKNTERRADSNQKLIQAAMELFAEKGYQRTTLVQIGQRAGFTGTLVSNRFGSKERILRAVLAHILNRFENRNLETSSLAKNAESRLSQFIEMYLRDVAEQGPRIRALYVLMGEATGALPEIADEIVKVNIVFREEVGRIIKADMGTGIVRVGIDVELATTLIVGLLRGISMQFLAEPERLGIDHLIEQAQKAAHKILCC